jgi:hypothetical protein
LHDTEGIGFFLFVERAEGMKRKKGSDLTKAKHNSYQWYKSPFGFKKPPEEDKENQGQRYDRKPHTEYGNPPETGGMKKGRAAAKQK